VCVWTAIAAFGFLYPRLGRTTILDWGMIHHYTNTTTTTIANPRQCKMEKMGDRDKGRQERQER
jgi:hypothetical protein